MYQALFPPEPGNEAITVWVSHHQLTQGRLRQNPLPRVPGSLSSLPARAWERGYHCVGVTPSARTITAESTPACTRLSFFSSCQSLGMRLSLCGCHTISLQKDDYGRIHSRMYQALFLLFPPEPGNEANSEEA